jgi:hypothetical protein
MNTANGGIHKKDVPDLQKLLDAVPADRTVACLPTQKYIILHDGEKELGSIPLDGVVDVSLLDDSSVQRNYPIGRSLLLGPLVFLFPKRTMREAYRLCIQWKGLDGDFHFTYIRIARRITAEQMLNALKRSLTPEGRSQLAPKVPKTGEPAAVPEKDQHKNPVETSPFITCAHCTMEFRKADLPPGGKCPVCGQSLNVSAR